MPGTYIALAYNSLRYKPEQILLRYITSRFLVLTPPQYVELAEDDVRNRAFHFGYENCYLSAGQLLRPRPKFRHVEALHVPVTGVLVWGVAIHKITRAGSDLGVG